MKYVVFFSFILVQSHIVKSETNSKLGSMVCKTIKLALENGSKVSYQDFSHCHLIQADNKRNLAGSSLDKAEELYHSLICHAHEFDNKREFNSGVDNVNIFIAKSNPTPRYLGLNKPANMKNIRSKAKNIPLSHSMGATLNFFQDNDELCKEFESRPQKLECNGKIYCFGMELKNKFSAKTPGIDDSKKSEMVGETNNSICRAHAKIILGIYQGCLISKGAEVINLTAKQITEVGCKTYCASAETHDEKSRDLFQEDPYVE